MRGFTAFDAEMMRLALAEAGQALSHGDVAVGAVIVRAGKVLCAAHNTREALHDPTGHAEINARKEAARISGEWRLTGCTVYVTLEPCCMCAGAIGQARPDRLVFGAYDESAGCCSSVYRLTEDPAFAWYVPADGGLLADECAEILRRSVPRQRSGQDLCHPEP